MVGTVAGAGAILDYADLVAGLQVIPLKYGSLSYYGYTNVAGTLETSQGTTKKIRFRNGTLSGAITSLQDIGTIIQIIFASNVSDNTDEGAFKRMVLTNEFGTTVSLERSASFQGSLSATGIYQWTSASTVLSQAYLSGTTKKVTVEFRND